MSLVLRHEPETIGLTLDAEGWASVSDLIRLAQQAGHSLDADLLVQVVEQNDKQRFALSADGERVRANHGHSVDVELGLDPVMPAARLYHGTTQARLASIRGQGLLPGKQRYVHLSGDEATAIRVGRRHGDPVVLIVEAGAMHAAGFSFFHSGSGVWLTEQVPVAFLEFP